MKNNFILFIFIAFSFSSCSETETSKEEINQNIGSTDLKQVVLNYANIVHASYVDSLNLAKNMQEKINSFLESPSQTGLDEAKQSWVDSRFPYLQTEVYRFYGGPIDDEDGPEGLLNAWPMDELSLIHI